MLTSTRLLTSPFPRQVLPESPVMTVYTGSAGDAMAPGSLQPAILWWHSQISCRMPHTGTQGQPQYRAGLWDTLTKAPIWWSVSVGHNLHHPLSISVIIICQDNANRLDIKWTLMVHGCLFLSQGKISYCHLGPVALATIRSFQYSNAISQLQEFPL